MLVCRLFCYPKEKLIPILRYTVAKLVLAHGHLLHKWKLSGILKN